MLKSIKQSLQLFFFVHLLLFMAFPAHSNDTVEVLTLPNLDAWETEVFSGETQYELIKENENDVLKAVSNSTASGLVRHIDVDLSKTPYMNWSWKIDNILSNVDETTKSGDDYAARIYVVISGGIFFWKTRAISYVWSNQKPAGENWPNPFTENALMISVRAGKNQVGEWVTEKRNILEDIKNILGLDATEINGVAIMSDTDNSKQSATAYFGNVYFSAN